MTSQCIAYMVTRVDWLSVRYLMLLQAMRLIEALIAEFACEFGLLGNKSRVVDQGCLRLALFELLFGLYNLIVLFILVRLQVLFAPECLITVCTVEKRMLNNRFLFHFDIYWCGVRACGYQIMNIHRSIQEFSDF
jgi:hypothetical protein